MNLPYNAFGGQNWIRTTKPKAYFVRRKSPAGEQGDILRKPDYHKLLQKGGADVEHEPWDRTPSFTSKAPFKLAMFILIAISLVLIIWLYVRGLNN